MDKMLEQNIKFLPNQKIPALAGIYLLHEQLSDKYYIGSTVNMRARVAHHRSLLLANKHPNKDLQKLFLTGNLVFKPLVSFPIPDKAKIREVEQYFIEASSVLFKNELINKRQTKALHLFND